jgi:hypothetical protein
MCGIVSIISKRQAGFFSADLEMFEKLLILDTTRGLDSTGAFSVDTGRNLSAVKVASHPFHMFACQDYPAWRGKAVQSGRILVGHNRKATQGSINSKNAHPFHSGNIVLVHNGTLRGDHKKDYAPVDVDSHSLAIAFDEKGAENVIPTINGAFALVWWDVEKNSLFAVRNDERPLQVVETADNFYVLSEAWMALQLLDKSTKVLDCYDIKPGELHEFKIGGKHATSEIKVQTDYWTTNYTTGMTGRSRGVQHGGAAASSVPNPKSQGSSSQTGRGGTSIGQSGTTTPSTTSQTSDSQSGNENKPGTSLTLVKTSNSTAPAGEAGKEAGNREPKMPMDLATHVPCAEFMVGMTVLVKLYEMKLNDSQELYFCRGRVVEPNCPDIDVACYVKVKDIEEGTVKQYVDGAVEGIVRKHMDGVCGRSLYVTKLTIPNFVSVHNNRLSETEWNYITAYKKCSECDSRIHDEDQGYTSVFRRPKNQFSVTCADCVEKSLKGKEQHEFTQNRLAALQAYERQCNTSSGCTEQRSPSEAAGSSTLH